MESVRKLLGREPLVLIVDDEPDICQVLEGILNDAGVPTETVLDGLQAISRLRAKAFDLVISDVSMPGLNGIELMRRARGLGLPVPFVLITGFQSDKVLIDAVRLGAVEFIPKPFQARDVVEGTTRALEISAREQAIERLVAGIEPTAPLVDALRRQISMLRLRSSTETDVAASALRKES